MSARPIRHVIRNQQPITATRSLSVREAARLMKRERVSTVLIAESGKLLGIFTEQDALRRVLAEGRDPDATTLAEVMTPDPITVQADRPLNFAMHMMYEGGFRHMPVIEDDGRVAGVVSSHDALGPELTEFEEELEERDHIAECVR